MKSSNIESAKFAHIEDDTQLGMIHLQKPRCIYWYGTGFGDYHLEWLDVPTVKEGLQIPHDIEQKTLELQREGTEGFSQIDYHAYVYGELS
ncbi:hypothetical protein [Gracilimonas sediminicola]|uniref:hypothetical protein n=1 Tax=Gracilimonas sediminicola TaxID=2952158 RepID=UPI0038D49873